jgi:molybdate transport system substrate-binding protein
MRALRRSVLIVSILLSLAGMAIAAEVRVLAVNTTEPALRTLAKEFAQESGHRAVFTFASTASVVEKIKANDVHDVIIVAEGLMDRLDKEGIANPESRVRLANADLGIVVRTGAKLPDVATADAFRQALMTAASIVHGDVAPYTSGAQIQKIFGTMGVLDAIKPKLKIVPEPADGQALIAKGEVELGLYHLSDIPEDKGVTLAGRVPRPLQIATTFEAARMSDGSAVEASEAFIRYIGGADGRPAWAKAKFEPLAEH